MCADVPLNCCSLTHSLTHAELVEWSLEIRAFFTFYRTAKTFFELLHTFSRTLPLTPVIAEWSACWTQAQKGPGSNRSRDAVG